MLITLPVLTLAACISTGPGQTTELTSSQAVAETTVGVVTAPSSTAGQTTTTATAATEITTLRPPWLGSRTVPTDTAGRGLAVDTPPELLDRRFATIDTLPPPGGKTFEATIEPLAQRPDVLERSTWTEGCPVGPDELSYLTLTFWGFDQIPHRGEMIVASTEAEGVVRVFNRLFDARFPIEEMRVVTPADLDAPATGDGNNTTGYVCRAVTGGSSFSEHAKGLAIDINPFHNPYQRGEVVLPEQATAYLDRGHPGLAGMIVEDDVVLQAFTEIGWEWGGAWRNLKDYQHFSATGL